MINAFYEEARSKMDKTIEAFRHELSSIRTGRASVGILEGVEVDAYGSKMKLNQLGTVTAPEARLLVVAPWDKSLIHAIEKGIQTSGLDLNPSNDGQVVRIPIPPLNEQRRRDLVKMVGKLAEESRVSARNIRRHALEGMKKMQKDGEIPEDDAHKLTHELQKMTDDHIAKIDLTLKHKEEEIMEV